jgi:hypothetical protein
VSTVVLIEPGLDESLPVSLPGARLVHERRAALRPPYGGPERRRLQAPRLRSNGTDLALVHICPDCGRLSIVPYRLGAGLAAAPPCPCSLPVAAPAADTGRGIVIGAALVLLWLFNIEDVLLTRRALSLGAIEANAIMGQFLRLGFVPAAVIKMSVVTAGVVFLWTQRRRRLVLLASVGLAAVYAGLVVYQLFALAGS